MMDSSLIQENLEEYIVDDNKVVTYRWLSLTLNIHVNQAKQELFSYVTSKRNKGGNDDVNVTYFVAGLGQAKTGEPCHRCIVVPEAEMDAVKSQLSTITSCHVYAVHRAKLKDTNAFYQADYDIIRNNYTVSPSLSAISCPWATLRAPRSASGQAARTDSLKEENSKPKVKGLEKDASVKEEKDKKKSEDSITKKPDSSSNPKTKNKTESKGSIASMFAANEKKSKDVQKKTETEKPQPSKQKVKPNEKQGGMKSFFTSQKDQGKTESEQKDKEASKVNTKTKSPEVIKKNKKPTPPSKKENKDLKKSKRKDDSDDDVSHKKSRKRIKTDLFDSSDEEEEDKNSDIEREEELAHNAAMIESEDEKKSDIDDDGKEPSPKPDKTKETENRNETSHMSQGNRKRKRTRKLVPKQYVDDEGFMVTEKVWESDSTDASEAEEPKTTSKDKAADKPAASAGKTGAEAKTKKPPAKKAAVSPQKGKQTSLMSFFKKK